MFVAVQHNISNPEAFWARAKEIVPNLPSHVKLHQCFPNKTGSRGICIWEGDSVKAVQTYLDGQVGHVSSNDYYEVENKGGDRAADGDCPVDEAIASVRDRAADEDGGSARASRVIIG